MHLDSRHVRLLLMYIRLRNSFHIRSVLVLCRPCNSPWLNTVLDRRHRLASPQRLPHFTHVRHTSGHRVCSIGFCSAHDLYVRHKASFCVTAGFPRPCCAAQALPEPPAAGSAGPDIRLLKPQLQKQWHRVRNQDLVNIQIHPNSAYRV